VLVFEHCGLLLGELVPGSGASVRERTQRTLAELRPYSLGVDNIQFLTH